MNSFSDSIRCASISVAIRLVCDRWSDYDVDRFTAHSSLFYLLIHSNTGMFFKGVARFFKRFKGVKQLKTHTALIC